MCSFSICTHLLKYSFMCMLCVQCPAIDYTRHTLDGAACLLNSNKYFPSRLACGCRFCTSSTNWISRIELVDKFWFILTSNSLWWRYWGIWYQYLLRPSSTFFDKLKTISTCFLWGEKFFGLVQLWEHWPSGLSNSCYVYQAGSHLAVVPTNVPLDGKLWLEQRYDTGILAVSHSRSLAWQTRK